jgi:hypothetical protein
MWQLGMIHMCRGTYVPSQNGTYVPPVHMHLPLSESLPNGNPSLP